MICIMRLVWLSCIFFLDADIQSHTQQSSTPVAKDPIESSSISCKKNNARQEQAPALEKEKKICKYAQCKSPSKQRTITVKNHITPDMITYKKHWTGHHKPSQLTVTLNDKEWSFNKKTKKSHTPDTETVALDNETVTVELYYQFKTAGITYKEDKKKFTYSVPSNIEQLDMSFTWEGDQKVILEGKSPTMQETIKITANN